MRRSGNQDYQLWRIHSELLDVKDLEPDNRIPFNVTKKFQGEPRKWDYNMRKPILVHDLCALVDLSLVAGGLDHIMAEIGVLSESWLTIIAETNNAQGARWVDAYLQFKSLFCSDFYSALNPGAELYLYSRCICSLLDYIPENKWHEDRTLNVARLLFQNGTEDHHNLAVVCFSLLDRGSRALKIARALSCMILNQLMANGKEEASLDIVSCQNIFKLLKHHNRVHELNSYHLYNTLKLLNFCVQMDYIQDKLSVAQLKILTAWLRNIGGNIITDLESIDWNNLKELISRYVSFWGIMLTDAADHKKQSIRSISPLTDDSIENDEEPEEQECGTEIR
ncbi:hypothetical protein C0J52_08250 [Blattella germanica]|nr:hypothetical protein C0J52_08250 [Blattella germanica]